MSIKKSRTERVLPVRSLIYTALFAALLAICSYITIPAPVPFTLQCFAVFLALRILGARRGTLAVAVWIALGAAGAPVFSGFAGGVSVLFGKTGGYIVGFLLTGAVYGVTVALAGNRTVFRVLGMLLGLIACYAAGTAWFIFVYTKASGQVALSAVLGWCVFPFIPADIVKLLLAMLLGGRLEQLLNRHKADGR